MWAGVRVWSSVRVDGEGIICTLSLIMNEEPRAPNEYSAYINTMVYI